MRIAALRYTGMTTAKIIDEKARELKSWLKDNGIPALGEPWSARYDPPWTIPFLRRNEVPFLTDKGHGSVDEDVRRD